MTPSGVVTTLHTFVGGDDGAEPVAALLQASDGSFYGTTSKGGRFDRGTIFRMSLGGQVDILHQFTDSPDGAGPARRVRGRSLVEAVLDRREHDPRRMARSRTSPRRGTPETSAGPSGTGDRAGAVQGPDRRRRGAGRGDRRRR